MTCILKNLYYYLTEILEVDLFAFAYRLFHEDFSPIYRALSISNSGGLVPCDVGLVSASEARII